MKQCCHLSLFSQDYFLTLIIVLVLLQSLSALTLRMLFLMTNMNFYCPHLKGFFSPLFRLYERELIIIFYITSFHVLLNYKMHSTSPFSSTNNCKLHSHSSPNRFSHIWMYLYFDFTLYLIQFLQLSLQLLDTKLGYDKCIIKALPTPNMMNSLVYCLEGLLPSF